MKTQINVYKEGRPIPTKKGGQFFIQPCTIVDESGEGRAPTNYEIRHFDAADVLEPGLYLADIRFYSREIQQRNSEYYSTVLCASLSNFTKAK